MDYLRQILKNKELRNKILFVLGILVVFRVIAHIPIPGPNPTQVREFLTNYFNSSNASVIGFLNIFSGGGLSQFSVILAGVGPYITASIIVQLLTMVIPSLQALSKEGEQGQHKINQYSRYLTVPIAAIQGYGLLRIVEKAAREFGVNIFQGATVATWVLMLVSIVAGSLFLMWLGELITEKGIGNGVSILIFAGIVSRFPSVVQSMLAPIITEGFSPAAFWKIVGYLAFAVLVVALVVVLTEGIRKIPISYAKKVRGNRIYGGMDTHLPLKINMAGVIPIIFAGAFMNLPQIIGLLQNARTQFVANFAKWVTATFTPTQWPYAVTYFVLIFGFTYFSTFLYFNPKDISENIQKQGGFIPGIRPGKQTAQYLVYVLNRLTLAGAIFLGLIAVLPFVLSPLTGSRGLSIGGTSLLIVVAVVLETIRKIQAQLIMRTYERA